MFSSIVAVWRTRGAFVVYHLGWWVISVFAMMAISVVTALVGSATAAITLLLVTMWPLSTIFYVTFWYGFADTFEIRPAGGDVDEGGDSNSGSGLQA